MTDAKKPPENERNPKQPESIFGKIGEDILTWAKNIIDTIKYKPNPKLVQLYCINKEEKKTLENLRYLDKYIFRLQIGKAQENEGSIYSKDMLKIGIEYMINHTEEGEKSIIQIWSDVGLLLLQGNEKGVLSSDVQLANLKDFIKKEFGKRGDCIDVIIGAQQNWCKDFFDNLREKKEGERRFGLIPEKEPDLRKYLSETPKGQLSPEPIIKYLAYHANKDPKLMDVFYDTKPPAYRKMDGENHIKGSIDADYYGIVEVGLRLTEILKGISIQGGIGRQRVYDKIISLILYGKDEIPPNKECSYYWHFSKESPNKKSTDTKKSKKSGKKTEHKHISYNALYNLHQIIKEAKSSNESGLNTDFKQLYIELDRNKLDRIGKKKKKKRQLIHNLAYSSLISLFLFGGVSDKKQEDIRINNDKTPLQITNTYPSYRTTKDSHKNMWEILHEINYPSPDGIKQYEYESEQEQKLIAEYDLSRFNYINNGIIEKNKIVELYRETANGFYRLQQINISSEDFMTYFIEKLVGYGIEYQEPYAHFKNYKQYIENTIKYGDTIDLSKHDVEEVKIYDEETGKERKFYYYNEQEHQLYRFKFVKLYKDNEESINLILARKYNSEEEFSLTNGFKCIQSLVENYGKNIGIFDIE